ncbi:hypothetical protein P3T36_006452 [Kitasatospora sp. MAP12-15]|nr:hypothetical protein [Kitasatospora sp. MAP12-44]
MGRHRRSGAGPRVLLLVQPPETRSRNARRAYAPLQPPSGCTQIRSRSGSGRRRCPEVRSTGQKKRSVTKVEVPAAQKAAGTSTFNAPIEFREPDLEELRRRAPGSLDEGRPPPPLRSSPTRPGGPPALPESRVRAAAGPPTRPGCAGPGWSRLLRPRTPWPAPGCAGPSGCRLPCAVGSAVRAVAGPAVGPPPHRSRRRRRDLGSCHQIRWQMFVLGWHACRPAFASIAGAATGHAVLAVASPPGRDPAAPTITTAGGIENKPRRAVLMNLPYLGVPEGPGRLAAGRMSAERAVKARVRRQPDFRDRRGEVNR